MKNLVFIVNGKPNSGKDTFTEKFFDYININNNVNYLHISTIDHIKDIAEYLFGWDGIKDVKGRKLLSDLKNASIDYNDGPFKYCINKINEHNKKTESIKNIVNISIVHCREPKEIKKFVDHFGREICKTILIYRKNFQQIISNDSDKNVNNYVYDYTIHNDSSLSDFYKEIGQFSAYIMSQFKLY